MNQELLKRTLKNRHIGLTNQEKKGYYSKKPLFILLLTPVALLFYPLMARIEGETIEPESVWFVVLFPVVFVAAGYVTYRNKKNTLKLHYISTALTPQEQQKVLIRLAGENRWKVILCNKQQLVVDDICMCWRVRIAVISRSPHMTYNGRCNPTRRWHASGGENHDNRGAVRQAIERKWTTKNEN